MTLNESVHKGNVMADDIVEFKLRMDKTRFEELELNAKNLGLDISEYISLLLMTVFSQEHPDPPESKKSTSD
jgi:hypothetical protein